MCEHEASGMIGSPRAINADDLEKVSRFLLGIYKIDAAAFADPEVLEWKYLRPRTDWHGSRGFVMERDGEIVAHLGVVPAIFEFPDGRKVRGGTLIDWAAISALPGTGALLGRHLVSRLEATFVIGGAPVTRQILPKARFRARAAATTYVKWIRPWKEFLARPKSSRSAIRLCHGLAYSLHSKRVVSKNWQSVPICHFSQSTESLLQRRSKWMTSCQRSVDTLNYMLECPAVPIKAFLLKRNDIVAGYFLIGKAAWEGRIVDIFVDSGDVNDWAVGYGQAAAVAAQEEEVCRVRAMASVPLLQSALTRNGFWVQQEYPIMVKDPKNALADALPINLQFFEADAAYLSPDDPRLV
jgi:hypothetical protein